MNKISAAEGQQSPTLGVKFHHWYDKAIIALPIFFLVSMVLTVVLQILSRNLGLSSMSWTEEAARWFWVWAVCCSQIYLEKNEKHLMVNFIVNRLPGKLRLLLQSLFDFVWLVALLFFLYFGWKLTFNTVNHAAVSLPLSQALLYVSYPLTAVFVLLQTLVCLHHRFRDFASASAE